MFVEDLLADFVSRIPRYVNDPVGAYFYNDTWTNSFVRSLYASVQAGRALSSEQSRVFLNIVKKLRKLGLLADVGHSDNVIDSLLLHPRYRRPPYQSTNIPREVRYLGDNKLGFRCKRIDEIVKDIKRLSATGMDASWREINRPVFNRQGRLWVVTVTAETYAAIINIIAVHDFKVDEAVIEYLALADSSKGQPSSFVYDPESEKIVANICDNPIVGCWMEHVLFGEIM
jgi:hypothetical protein